jgi:two-component system chemotaxis response regulator CheY
MVVDDSVLMRRHAARVLKQSNHDVIEAGDGRKCIDLLQTEAVDIILLDWNMPEMNGLEALTKIRSDHRYENIKILMMTSENKNERIQEALDRGADEYIMKPLSEEIIIEKINSIHDNFI